jgi:hypothetical protein
VISGCIRGSQGGITRSQFAQMRTTLHESHMLESRMLPQNESADCADVRRILNPAAVCIACGLFALC